MLFLLLLIYLYEINLELFKVKHLNCEMPPLTKSFFRILCMSASKGDFYQPGGVGQLFEERPHFHYLCV